MEQSASLTTPKNFIRGLSVKNIFSFFSEYKIVLKDGPPAATTEEFIEIKSYFWGIRKPIVIANNCRGNGFHSVMIRKSFGQYLTTILTLGIVSKVSVGWECSKDNRII